MNSTSEAPPASRGTGALFSDPLPTLVVVEKRVCSTHHGAAR